MMSNKQKTKTKWTGITIIDKKMEEKNQIVNGRIKNNFFADEISKQQLNKKQLKKKKKKSTSKEPIKCPKCNINLSTDHEKMQNHFKSCMANISKEEGQHIIEAIDEIIFKLDSIDVIKEFRHIVNIFSNPRATHYHNEEMIQCPKCSIKIKATKFEKHLKKCGNQIKNNLGSQKIENIPFVLNLNTRRPVSIERRNQLLNNQKNISCPYCSKNFSKINGVFSHIQAKHSKQMFDFLKQEEVKILLGNLIQCKYCNLFFLDTQIDKHLKKCLKHKEKKKVYEDINYKVPIKPYQSEYDSQLGSEEIKTQPLSKKNTKNTKIRILDKETYWEETSPIKEPTIIDNVLKHQADSFQYKDDEELDPDMIIDEEQYQEEFINNLSKNKINIVKTERVVFQKSIVDKEEKDLKSDIKIFLSKMYKGYCQVCGFTFKKLNGENSFEMFNWNDKRVVKVKKSFISTADSLCLCRNCSANIKWGAFTPVFIDKINNIEDFQHKKPDEVKKLLHNVVDGDIPDIFKDLIDFDDMYALEIELQGEPRNIYFTNEHLLQFIAYLQTEEEFEEEILFKKKKDKKKQISNRIYSSNSWLKREETIPESLARDFVRASAWWLSHPSGAVRAPRHALNVYNNAVHGWTVDFGANKFLVGKAIERCKIEINNYIEKIINGEHINIDVLKETLKGHISGSVAHMNNDEYSGFYPITGSDLKFGSQSIDVNDGVKFLLNKLGINEGF